MNHYSIIIKTEWFLYREEHDRQKYPKYVCMHIQIEHGLQIVKTDKLWGINASDIEYSHEVIRHFYCCLFQYNIIKTVDLKALMSFMKLIKNAHM